MLFIHLLLFFLSSDWGINMPEAQKEAQISQKLILLNFSGSDWCGPCIKLKEKVFEAEDFKKFADENLLLVRADFPRNKKNKLSPALTTHNEGLAEKYNKEGKFPYTVLLNAKGQVLKTWDGFPRDLTPTKIIADIKLSKTI